MVPIWAATRTTQATGLAAFHPDRDVLTIGRVTLDGRAQVRARAPVDSARIRVLHRGHATRGISTPRDRPPARPARVIVGA